MRSAVVAVVLANAGCAPADSPAAQPALNQIDPARLRSVVEAATSELAVPGAMVALRTPQGTFDIAVGTTELGATQVPDAHTRFRIASNTKTMTAALILLLAQDGTLSLDDPVSRYVPDVPNGANISIEQLL
ncbi:MAG: serine hydrolase domain-containing protein, partial [Mycobacterium sp.]